MSSIVKPAKSIIACMLSIILAVSMCPLSASAAEQEASEEVDVPWVDDLDFEAYDKASVENFGSTVLNKEEFYEEGEESAISLRALPTVKPRALSKEFRYFAKYESSQNYDQGFSPGDGYNALGYYQFDRRYGLKNFMQACYNYNPKKYAMLWTKDIQKMNFSTMKVYDYKTNKLTSNGKKVEAAWHAAYAAAPTEFSNLQNDWAYTNYYVPAYNHLKNNLGIDIKNRRACVKGLVWGMCNLFGQGGWRQFVGGYFNGVNHKGAGLKSSMTDVEFVTKLCNYVVKNVARFYPSQPEYHQGWERRYRLEKADCLEYLYLSDIDPNAWYATCGAIDYVVSNGIMTGYDNGLFGPYDYITRGQVATILYRYSNPGSTDTVKSKDYATSSKFKDVAGKKYYTAAINWC